MNQDRARRGYPLWLQLVIGFSLCLAVLFVANYESCSPYFRTLPSDEEMIANFHKHRADFERLVQIYREDLSVPTDAMESLVPSPEIRAMMECIKVSQVRGDQVLWVPPDPYRDQPNSEKDKLERESLPGSPERRKFAGVIFRYRHQIVARIFCGGDVDKRYYYIPLVPKVLKGMLVLPASIPAYGNGPLLETLNTYPPDLGPFEAAYRQIERHWFIQMRQHKE